MSASPNAIYSTHRLVLLGLSSWLSSNDRGVRKVLELGSGPASTGLFLTLPQLESLLSLETDQDWAKVVSMLYGGDKRLSILYSKSEDDLLIAARDSAPYDIALVDGPSNANRLLAIPRCLEMARFVVVHDTQEDELAAARSMAPHTFTSVIESPWTTVLSLHEPPFGYSCNGKT
jgi:hypothetical protein